MSSADTLPTSQRRGIFSGSQELILGTLVAQEFQENKKILIYDLGGGTFDITLINLTVDENGKYV